MNPSFQRSPRNPASRLTSGSLFGTRVIRGENGAFRDAGFTLIEVALALGILAFALIPVMGLMPIGLTTMRDTIDTTISSQIAETIVNDAEQSDYSSLGARTFYFDEQGDLLTSSNGALYKAQLAVTEPTTIPSTLVPTTSQDLATLSITVQLTTSLATRTLSALVARATH